MNYNPFNKKLQDINKDDLESLINRSISEGWYIEYKSNYPSSNGNLDNQKIAKSISSFANTKGGWIFWGFESDKYNKPTNICGLDISKFKNFQDQVSQIISSNINPTPIFHFKQIDLENDRIVLIIQVEESPTPPYITSQGQIFQRENNESKPINERYIIEKLNEKTENYYNRIENFSQFDLGETRGQADSNQSFLELYLFPLPFDGFRFENFYDFEFFKTAAIKFYENVDCDFGFNKDKKPVSLNLGFNSIYSAERSLIIRPLNERNLIYKSTTVELFDNGNLKFTIPIYDFDSNNIPRYYHDSKTLEYILDKFSPFETKESYDIASHFGGKFEKLPPVTRRKETDFVNHIRFIDGAEFIYEILIIISKYKAVLESNNFDFSTKIGFRARITNAWRKFVFFDGDSYLENIKLFNLPISPKAEIEVPCFGDGDCYVIDLNDKDAFFMVSRFILEGIGLPNSNTIDFMDILEKGLSRYKTEKHEFDDDEYYEFE